jgi:hypothetical protein
MYSLVDFWSRKLRNPDLYNITPHCRKLITKSPIIFNGKSVKFPHYGAGSIYTKEIVDSVFKAADEAYTNLHITSRVKDNLKVKIKYWQKAGDFDLKGKKITVKKKSTRGKRVATLTEDQISRRKKLAPVIEMRVESMLREYLSIADGLFNDLPRSLFFARVVKYSSAQGVTRSRAGRKDQKPYARFAFSRIMDAIERMGGADSLTFYEYDMFANDPEIGQITGSLEVYLSALVTHELGHMIQFAVLYECEGDEWSGIPVSSLYEGHGVGWQTIYRKLRNRITNRLPNIKKIGR